MIKCLLSKDVPSGIYHMGDDEALSTNELIEVICSALGKKARVWRVPERLMLFAARVGDWLHLPLNTRTDGELSGLKRQDQGCFGDERDAGES